MGINSVCMCVFLSCSVEASGVGFILVIDRRLDRWAAVRATLLRIAVRTYLFGYLFNFCVCVSMCVRVGGRWEKLS